MSKQRVPNTLSNADILALFGKDTTFLSNRTHDAAAGARFNLALKSKIEDYEKIKVPRFPYRLTGSYFAKSFIYNTTNRAGEILEYFDSLEDIDEAESEQVQKVFPTLQNIIFAKSYAIPKFCQPVRGNKYIFRDIPYDLKKIERLANQEQIKYEDLDEALVIMEEWCWYEYPHNEENLCARKDELKAADEFSKQDDKLLVNLSTLPHSLDKFEYLCLLAKIFAEAGKVYSEKSDKYERKFNSKVMKKLFPNEYDAMADYLACGGNYSKKIAEDLEQAEEFVSYGVNTLVSMPALGAKNKDATNERYDRVSREAFHHYANTLTLPDTDKDFIKSALIGYGDSIVRRLRKKPVRLFGSNKEIARKYLDSYAQHCESLAAVAQFQELAGNEQEYFQILAKARKILGKQK